MEKQQLAWLGVRQSDIADTNGLFHSSITLFGAGAEGNYSMEKSLGWRMNHNENFHGYQAFMQESMRKILKAFPGTRFVQYDPLDGKAFSQEFQDKFCYQNDYAVNVFLEHKLKLKRWAKSYVPVLPYKIVLGHACNGSDLREMYPGHKAVVVQRDSSCGGVGTFLLHLDSGNVPKIPVKADEKCMVTSFQANSISVNLHAVLYSDKAVLFPPSIQIIDQGSLQLKYLGADFSAYRTVSLKEQKLVQKTATILCDQLRTLGYRGVCGIDFLLVDGGCYFMEINPRFQASTAMLNHDFVQSGIPSLQEYHIDAFLHENPTLPQPPEYANGSFFIYHYHKEQEQRLYWMWDKLQNAERISLCDDCLSWKNRLEDGCYVFQARAQKAISSITFQHTLRLHPNLQLSTFEIGATQDFENLLRIKLLLLSRGVEITHAVWETAQKYGSVDFEEFNAVTMRLFGKIWITAPCCEHWHTISPMKLDVLPDKEEIYLLYYGKALFPVELMPEDPCGKLQTAKGTPIKDIVYLNPDRLRVYHRSGCALQNAGVGCRFCDLFYEENAFDFDEICEALSYYWDNPRVEHFLIGGGSQMGPGQWDSILRLAEFLHAHSDKNIYVMSQPICDIDVLRRLKEFGVTEVAFNIEMFDRSLAFKIMPGKAKNTLEDYFKSLKNAVSLFGDQGNVRSVIMLGFDDLELFSQGIRKLCQIGVAPILSLYRPCAETAMADFMPIDECDAFVYYEVAARICKEYGKKLGPSCKACQNNTVVLDL